MKARLLLLSSFVISPSAWLLAQQPQSRTAGESPPVLIAPVRPNQVTLIDEQKLYAPVGTLVAPEQARAIVDQFKAAYEKLGKPRLLLYVNRELVDDASGLKLVKRTERTEAARTQAKSDRETPAPSAAPQTQVNVSVGGAAGHAATVMPGKGTSETSTEKVNAENTYEAKSAQPAPLADRQTVRDLERLFGRPLRLGGAMLADQKVATEIIADKPMSHFTAAGDDQARKDREALAKVADVVVEILISSRKLTVPEVSGDKTYTVPDIAATAIRLRDSAILGQASARDVLGKDRDAGRLVRQFDVNDIAEATALALMEDVALSAQ